jgi:uncharacterized protein
MHRFHLRRLRSLAFAFVFVASLAFAQPARTGWVTDQAGALSPDQRARLAQQLHDYEQRTSFELAVVLVRSLDGKTIEDYSYDLARAWKVGKAGKDNGVLLLLALDDRKMRIETGKGVGHLLTDVESADILDRTVRPRLRENNVDLAVREGVSAIQRELGTAAQAPPPTRTTTSKSEGLGFLLLLVFVALQGALVFLLMKVLKRLLSRNASGPQQPGTWGVHGGSSPDSTPWYPSAGPPYSPPDSSSSSYDSFSSSSYDSSGSSSYDSSSSSSYDSSSSSSYNSGSSGGGDFGGGGSSSDW